jgi:hypothetical protein
MYKRRHILLGSITKGDRGFIIKSASTMSEFYATACAMNKASPAALAELLKFIGNIVGYPCTILCDPADSMSVNIAVVSKQFGVTTDWLLLQANGSLGVRKYLYPSPEAAGFLEVVCERQNAAHGLVFVPPK